jgi:hypothetical protein
MKEQDAKNLEQQQERLALMRARVNAAKIAYLHRAPFESKTEVSYEDLKTIAQEYINASYEYQKLKYGSVKVRISVPKLLRR